jgi:hypothetical protein
MESTPIKKPVEVKSIRDIQKLINSVDLLEAFNAFESEFETSTKTLCEELDKSILSTDITTISTHMAFVESWRQRIVRYSALASAFYEHSKSSVFLMPKAKGVSDLDRDANRRTHSAGFAGLVKRLDGLVDCIDCRVNLCKKVLYVEAEGRGPSA